MFEVIPPATPPEEPQLPEFDYDEYPDSFEQMGINRRRNATLVQLRLPFGKLSTAADSDHSPVIETAA